MLISEASEHLPSEVMHMTVQRWGATAMETTAKATTNLMLCLYQK